MAWKLLRNKIGKSNKSELDFLKEDLLSDPYKKLDMEEMSSILEKGISQRTKKEKTIVLKTKIMRIIKYLRW